MNELDVALEPEGNLRAMFFHEARMHIRGKRRSKLARMFKLALETRPDFVLGMSGITCKTLASVIRAAGYGHCLGLWNGTVEYFDIGGLPAAWRYPKKEEPL